MEATGRCNNCGTTDYKILYKEDIAQVNQIVKCNCCGLMYAYPLNIDPEKKYWEGSSKIPKKSSVFKERLEIMIDQKEKIQVHDYLSSIKHVEKLIPAKGKALEVGSSRGYFLHELEKRGWNVVGIEPSDTRREEAKRIFGYNFIPDKLEDTGLPKNSFDAIFMFHVIEHVLDPSAIISILYKYLKPGGVLVVETPTYDTITYKERVAEW